MASTYSFKCPLGQCPQILTNSQGQTHTGSSAMTKGLVPVVNSDCSRAQQGPSCAQLQSRPPGSLASTSLTPWGCLPTGSHISQHSQTNRLTTAARQATHSTCCAVVLNLRIASNNKYERDTFTYYKFVPVLKVLCHEDHGGSVGTHWDILNSSTTWGERPASPMKGTKFKHVVPHMQGTENVGNHKDTASSPTQTTYSVSLGDVIHAYIIQTNLCDRPHATSSCLSIMFT
jgi:hypothetical protein